jgi:hypothetical protein
MSSSSLCNQHRNDRVNEIPLNSLLSSICVHLVYREIGGTDMLIPSGRHIEIMHTQHTQIGGTDIPQDIVISMIPLIYRVRPYNNTQGSIVSLPIT